MKLTREGILGALARGYCTPANSRKEVDAALIEAMAGEILALRGLGTQEPIKHMDMNGETLNHADWIAAGDRTKEWYSTPLYASPVAGEILALRGLGTQEPIKHMDMNGETLNHADWIAAGDRTKEWYSTPLYASPVAAGTVAVPREPLAVTEEGASIKLVLEHALSTLECGRAFVDVDQTEIDNWKGHATIVEDEIKAILSQFMNNGEIK